VFTPDPHSESTAASARPKKRRLRHALRGALGGSLSLTLVAALIPPAWAGDDEDDDDTCTPRIFFKRHHLSPRNFFVPRTRFTDGPGGSMTVRVEREHEVVAWLQTENERQREIRDMKATSTTNQRGRETATETTTVRGDQTVTEREAESTLRSETEITAHELVRRLRKMGVPHLEERHKVFVGHEYTHEISKGMYGNMWYRVFGYRIGWSAWRVLGTCRHVYVTSGIANVPARVEGWRYWETKCPRFKKRKLWRK
jgi:hypothetical protein